LFRSLFAGYMGVIIVIVFLHAITLDEVFFRELYTVQVKLQSNYSLAGRSLSWFQKFKLRLGSSLSFVGLALLLFTLYNFLENSQFSLDDLALSYISNRPDSPLLALTLVLFFINVSLRIFDGIFDFLQTDLYSVLGRLLYQKRNQPKAYKNYEKIFDAALQTQSEDSYGSQLNLAATDRFFDLHQLDDTRFRIAFFVFSLDVLLTASAVLGLPIFPGLTIEQTTILSTVLKIPILIIFLLSNSYRWMLKMFSEFSPNYYAKIYRLSIERMLNRFADLEKLLKLTQVQQLSKVPYIDVSENTYLLSLAEVRKYY